MAPRYTKNTKVAGLLGDLWGGMKSVGKDPHFLGSVGLMGAAGAAGLAGKGVDSLLSARKKTMAYREMLNMHPHLRQRDQKEVSRIYNSVHNVNPQLARDPLVAGAMVDNIIESANTYQGQANLGLISMVKDLSGIRSNMSQALYREPQGASAALQSGVQRIGDSALTRMSDLQKEKGMVAATRANAESLADRQKGQIDLLRTQAGIAAKTMAYHRAADKGFSMLQAAHAAGVQLHPAQFQAGIEGAVNDALKPMKAGEPEKKSSSRRLLSAVLR